MVMVKVGELGFMPLRPIGKCLCLCALGLSILASAGCDGSASSTSQAQKSSAARTEKLKTNLSLDEMRQIAQSANETPGLSVDAASAQSGAFVSEQMNGVKGLNVRLFDTSVSDDDTRFERLENAVQKLRDDFDTMAPAINRLVAVEREIQGLVDQLQVLVGGQQSVDGVLSTVPPVSASDLESANPLAPLPSPVPMPPIDANSAVTNVTQNVENNMVDANKMDDLKPLPILQDVPAETASPVSSTVTATADSKMQAQTPLQPSSLKAVSLSKARAADHAGKSRVVFEINDDVPYDVRLEGNALIVTFKNSKIDGGFSDSLTASKLVAGAAVTNVVADGTVLTVPLKKPSSILSQGILKPEAGSSNYRLYIDLAQ